MIEFCLESVNITELDLDSKLVFKIGNEYMYVFTVIKTLGILTLLFVVCVRTLWMIKNTYGVSFSNLNNLQTLLEFPLVRLNTPSVAKGSKIIQIYSITK